MSACYTEEEDSINNLMPASQVFINSKGEILCEFADNQVKFSYLSHLQRKRKTKQNKKNKNLFLHESLCWGKNPITIWVQQKPRKIQHSRLNIPGPCPFPILDHFSQPKHLLWCSMYLPFFWNCSPLGQGWALPLHSEVTMVSI